MTNPQWPPKRIGIMLCYPFEEGRLAKWDPPYLVQPKYDGERCRAVPVGGSYVLLSSEENVIVSVPHINEALDKLFSRHELDGELYHHGWPFEEIFSVVSRTKNIHPEYEAIQYHIFDTIVDGPQVSRLQMIPELGLKPPLVRTPVEICWSFDDVMRAYDKFVDRGFEGIVARHVDNEYVRRRTPMMMKFKPKKDDFYEVIDYNEEIDKNGNPKGRLGSLVCRGTDGTVFKVGSGLTDADRESLWTARETLAGKLCHVKYQHLTAGRKVPRFPVFVSVVDRPTEGD